MVVGRLGSYTHLKAFGLLGGPLAIAGFTLWWILRTIELLRSIEPLGSPIFGRLIVLLLSFVCVTVLLLIAGEFERTSPRPYGGKPSGRIFELVPIVGFRIYTLLVAILAIALYIEFVYPALPQELGGIRPRCAAVDIITDKVSDQLLAALAISKDVTPVMRVVRSNVVDVLYTSNDFLIVKLRVPASSQSTYQRPVVYQLSRDVVGAITWCR